MSRKSWTSHSLYASAPWHPGLRKQCSPSGLPDTVWRWEWLKKGRSSLLAQGWRSMEALMRRGQAAQIKYKIRPWVASGEGDDLSLFFHP